MTGVVEGKDGWLFLAGGMNNAERIYKDPHFLPKGWASQWSTLIKSRQLMTAQIGAQYLHLIAPEKTSIYPELFPEPLPLYGRHPCGYLSGLQRPDLLGSIIDPSLAFMQEKYKRDVYLRNDSHWNIFGAQIVVNLAMQRLGYEQRIDVEALSFHEHTMVGDLANKLPDRRSEARALVRISPFLKRSFANKIVAYNECYRGQRPAIHVGGAASFTNSSPTAIDQRVLIFGDSYSGYEAGGLTHLFAELFRKVQFVWSQNVDTGLLQTLSPDILITEGAERFMSRVPNDRFDLSSFVNEKLAEAETAWTSRSA
ncbi:MAG: alginate O-acetyltransferase AlgX-related protein [Janthinobacterium lividum]